MLNRYVTSGMLQGNLSQDVKFHGICSTWNERTSFVVASSSFSLFFSPLGLALVEPNATHIIIASFVAQHVLKGDFGVVAPL